MKRYIRKNNGFSMAEVIIALTILTIGILAIVGVFPSLFKLNSNSWNLVTATTLCQEKLDQIMQNGQFIRGVDSQSIEHYTTDYPSSLPGSGGYRRYIGDPDCPDPNNPPSGMSFQKIYVEVRWVEKGRPREVKMMGSIYKQN